MNGISGVSWISQQLPVSLWSGVHVGEWTSNHIFNWLRSSVSFLFVGNTEACCILHVTDLMHPGNWCHCHSLRFPLMNDEFDSLENVCITSYWTCTTATCAFRTSRLSVEVLISKLGQVYGSCNCIMVPSTTMVMMKELQVYFLAILNWQDWTETAHVSSFEENVYSWMMATLLPTNAFIC